MTTSWSFTSSIWDISEQIDKEDEGMDGREGKKEQEEVREKDTGR